MMLRIVALCGICGLLVGCEAEGVRAVSGGDDSGTIVPTAAKEGPGLGRDAGVGVVPPVGSDALSDALSPDTTPLAPGECDPFTDAGCPAGQECAALEHSTASHKFMTFGCSNVGSKRRGEACTQATADNASTGEDCGDRLACFDIGEGTWCLRPCDATNDPACYPAGAETWTLGVSMPGGIVQFMRIN